MRRLPPLNAIRVFDAAARHASFKRAANELNVTHGAVSRQIALLEEWFGAPLFRRLNRRVALTEEGWSLFTEVSPALDRIALAAAVLTQRRTSTALTVNAPPTFLMRWLIPRLPRFVRQYPTIEVRLTASIKPVEFDSGSYDLAIRRLRVIPPGLQHCSLLPEMRMPVCSPDLLSRTRITEAKDLQSQVLIHTASAPAAWPEWFEGVGCEGAVRAEHALSFEEMFYAVQAAINGLGIALVPAALVTDDIEAGRLVFPLPLLETRDHAYRAIYKPNPEKERALAEFANWLVHEGEAAHAAVRLLLEKRPKAVKGRRGKAHPVREFS